MELKTDLLLDCVVVIEHRHLIEDTKGEDLVAEGDENLEVCQFSHKSSIKHELVSNSSILVQAHKPL